ncbi:MAG: hypothetical protein IKY66_03575 [Bacteroidales bacterium]|nr:hypothetical protein [Bacteroidales bacterium]
MAGEKGTYEAILNQQDAEDTQSGVMKTTSFQNGGTEEKKATPQLSQQEGTVKTVVAPQGQAETATTTAEPKRLTYVEMMQQMNPYKPPTEEELEKERKKRKTASIVAAIGDGISAMSNLYFTTQGAPSMYNAKDSMSGKLRERWDKVDAERKKNTAAYVSAYMQAQQADDAVERDGRNWKRQIERDKLADKRYEDEQRRIAERQKIEDERYEARTKQEAERWQKTFDEQVRQFNVSSQQAATRLKNESARLAREMAKDKVAFALGEGMGSISIPKDALNNANISYVFNKLPEAVRSQIKGAPIKGKDIAGQDIIVGYQDPTPEAMLIAIGANIEGNIDAQNALRELAGEKPVPKPSQPTSQKPSYDPEQYDYYSNGQQSIQVPKGTPKPVGYKKPNPMN